MSGGRYGVSGDAPLCAKFCGQQLESAALSSEECVIAPRQIDQVS